MVDASTSGQSNIEISIKKNRVSIGRFKLFFFVLLSTIPEIFFWSFSLYIIKMRARDYIRCEIKALENTSWNFQEIKDISQITGYHKECFIYKFDYNKITHMSFQKARHFLNKEYINKTTVLCKNFVINGNKSEYTKKYQEEFSSYCRGLEYDIIYDLFYSISFIFSCIFILPLADIYGRKRTMNIGWQLVCFSLLIRVVLLDSDRNIVATIVLNAAYPALKFTTHTIMFEISSGRIRPSAVMLTYTGSSICFTIFGLLPPISWQYMRLLTLCPFLFLPLVKWFVPESPLWLMSNNGKEAQFSIRTMNKTAKHNASLISLSNKKITCDIIKAHVQELQSTSVREYISLILTSFGVGTLSFYSYSKYKFSYHYFDNSWIRVLNYLNGLYAIIFCICLVHICKSKFLIIVFLLANSVIYMIICKYKLDLPYENFAVMLITLTEIFGVCVNISFQFYLAEIAPTNHRCTYVGFYNAVAHFGLLIVSCVRLKNVLAAEIITILASLIASINIIQFKNNRQL